MNRKYQILLLVFILLDTAYSFYQHFHTPLDGDLAAIVWPGEWYRQVLKEPFGLSAVLDGQRYAGTNRFVAHWSLSEYYKTIPILLQNFVSPINSVYLAGAIVKTLVQLMLIWLLARYITLSGFVPKKYFLLTFALLVPLFQTMGYNNYLGIIAKSVTYTFFYALPLAFLMLFFLPFYRNLVTQKLTRLNMIWKGLLFLLALILPFQGSINPAVLLIICPAVLLFYWWQQFKLMAEGGFIPKTFKAILRIPGQELFYLSLAMLVSLYSLYLGTFNAENLPSTVPLGERFLRLFPGLFFLFTGKPGYPLLLLLLGINSWLLRRSGPGGKLF